MSRGLSGFDAPFDYAGMGVVFDPGTLILSALSAGVGAVGSIMSGNMQASSLKFEAQQADMKAREERATASHEAAMMARKEALIRSRQVALAASQGGSATDPTILDIMGDTAAQGFLDRGVRVATGENAARGYEDLAASKRASAKSAKMGGYINAFSSVIGAAGSAYKNMPDPKAYRPASLPTYTPSFGFQ